MKKKTNTVEVYRIYGLLGCEYTPVFCVNEGVEPQDGAYDTITIELPKGYTTAKNGWGETLLEDENGDCYPLNDMLCNIGDDPAIWTTSNGKIQCSWN